VQAAGSARVRRARSEARLRRIFFLDEDLHRCRLFGKNLDACPSETLQLVAIGSRTPAQSWLSRWTFKECGGESRVFGYADIISGGLSYITACLL
jgi:hypothetical protein